MTTNSLYASVDIGSNSFRLEIGKLVHGQITRSEYLKETIRLGAGLDTYRNLSQESMSCGWDCLARFGERLAGFKPHQVRAVATQTLREARNREIFIRRAQEVLGFPIDVISGPEEARLIYKGVSHFLPESNEKRLVIDIGGRSTELILGKSYLPEVMNSFRVGSFSWSKKYFSDGKFDNPSFEKARIAAQAILDEALALFPKQSWDVAFGSSGTVGAIADMLDRAGWPVGVISRESLDWLKRQFVRFGHVSRLQMDGLKEDRKEVIGGGISVLDAVMEMFNIEILYIAHGGLRHGVLYEMLDRKTAIPDARNQSVLRLQNMFGVDQIQARRVEQVARYFLDPLLKEGPEEEALRHKRKLSWAAQLHELGNIISHSDAHKHGAYILEHADVTGFALTELHRLGLLVLGQKGKLKKVMIDHDDKWFFIQMMCLRLAVILCHARKDPAYESLSLQADIDKELFILKSKQGWSDKHPQSAHLLMQEVIAWQKTGWALDLDGFTSQK